MMRAALILALLLFLASPAHADENGKPATTKAVYIAMLYQHLSGIRPDFEKWIADTSVYRNAALHERVSLMTQKKSELQQVYSLITPAEPVIIDVPVKLTGYSQKKKGFLVPAFNDMTFFSYEYMGQRYALIPNKINEHAWLKSPPEFADAVMRETDNGHKGVITMTLLPLSADKKPMTYGGREYRLVMADISKMEIWSKDCTRTVWEGRPAKEKGKANKLINLYQ